MSVPVPTTPTNPAPKPGDRVRVNDLGTHHDAVGNVLHREDDVMLVVKLDGIAGKWLYAADELDVLPAVPATQDDLREQIQRVLRERCEVEDRQYTDGTGWVLVRDDNAAQVVADYFAPVLEGLRADVRETALAVVKALYPPAVGEVLMVFRESDVASISAAALKAREGRK